jgi:hypothetical protein
MRIGGLEFNLRELAGSMGDFGTLLPLAIITVTGSLLWNMAAGFLMGMVVHYILLHKEKLK